MRHPARQTRTNRTSTVDSHNDAMSFPKSRGRLHRRLAVTSSALCHPSSGAYGLPAAVAGGGEGSPPEVSVTLGGRWRTAKVNAPTSDTPV
jgi:hypothetical protein